MAVVSAAKACRAVALLPLLLLVALTLSPLPSAHASAGQTPWVGTVSQHLGNTSSAADVAAIAVPMRHVSVVEDEDEPEIARREMLEPTAATAAMQCLKPTVKGFASSMLMEPGLFLNWKITKTGAVAVAIHAKATTTAARGWIAVGWSATGLMSPAEAIAGNLPHGGLQGYKLNTYTSVVPTNSIAFKGRTVSTTAAGTVISFIRRPGDGGKVPVTLRQPNRLVWAYSNDGTKAVGYHGSNVGALTVIFACNGATGKVPGNPNTPPPPPYKPPPIVRSNKCPVSSLPGFIYMTDLAPGVVLHWRLYLRNVVEVAIEAKAGSGAESGWLSLGWSANGRMGGSEAIIGNKGAGVLGAYDIMGYSMTSIQPKILALGDAAAVYKNGQGSTIMRFRRARGKFNRVAVNPWGINTLVWAYSKDNTKTFTYHGGNCGWLTVDFSCKVPPYNRGRGENEGNEGEYN
ncbi:hypothetical protein CLOM_g14258 [Closterium sp. NIES-68]|nr:hypothetical protein CLOM_g14258 [Closterium sp. NIES-68]GJP59107.1 hypothetical protein CLOP_g7656 [Closterium sp. NIES-67]